MVSNARDDLPEPLSPVSTTNWSLGISTLRFLRLFSLAPRILIKRFLSFASADMKPPTLSGHKKYSGILLNSRIYLSYSAVELLIFYQYTVRTFVRQGEKIDKFFYSRKSAITPLLTWIPFLERYILSPFCSSIPISRCFFRTSP